MTDIYLIAATVLFALGFIIWQRCDFFNFLIKTVLFGMTIMGILIYFKLLK